MPVFHAKKIKVIRLHVTAAYTISKMLTLPENRDYTLAELLLVNREKPTQCVKR